MAEPHLRSFVRRWRAMLDDVVAPSSLQRTRGDAYERSMRVTDLRVALGGITARVQGSRATPYPVEVSIDPLDDAAWERVVERIAGQVRYVAALLAGQLPEGLESELSTLDVRLVPDAGWVRPACPCADPTPWCAHVVALWQSAGVRLASDPFVLLQLRGRGRERLLAELAEARRAGGPLSAGLPVNEVDVRHWRQTDLPPHDIHLPPLRRPPRPDTVLQMLGDPPGWQGNVSASALFGPLIDRAATWADALTTDTPPADDAPRSAPRG